MRTRRFPFSPAARRGPTFLFLPAFVLALAPVWGPAAAQSGFQKVTTGPVVETSGQSLGFAWGDSDGDGDLDLFVANGTAAVVGGYFVNEGAGSFSQSTDAPLATDVGNSTDAEWGDLDGDGDQDLYVTRRNTSPNAYFINQGGAQAGVEGSFAKDFLSKLVADTSDSRAAVFGDIDGDGDLDVLVANGANQNNAVYVNQGGLQGGTTGIFVKQSTGPIVTDGGASLGVALADADNDGDLDPYFGNDAQANFLYRNDGGGAFAKVTGVHPVTDVHGTQDVAWGDLDGDGDQDLVAANFGNNDIYLNQGGVQGGVVGTFSKVISGTAVSDNSPSLGLALGDADGDGDVDIYLANCCSQDDTLYLNNGSGGQFTADATGPWVANGGYGTAAGFVDYDGDGDLDLFVTNIDSMGKDLNALYRHVTVGEFTKVTTGPLATDVKRSFDVIAGDTDGDGDLDLFAPNSNGDDNSFYVNQGGQQGGTEGDFLAGSGAQTTGGGDSWGADFGDLDGDGDLDLFVANRAGQDDFLYLNDGGLQGGTQGSFTRILSDPAASSGGNGRDTSLADIDGDGDLDICVANSEDTGNFLYRNLGGAQGGTPGTFAALVSPVTTDGGDNYSLAWGDIDSDGDPDLFVANRAGGNFLYLNVGGLQGGTQGVFARIINGPVVTDGGQSYGCAFADMDGDGDQDLFVANGTGLNFLYRNLGGAQGGSAGSFERLLAGPVGTDAAASRRPSWGDADGDGDPDLFVPNVLGADNSFYRNLGGGSFEAYGGVVSTDGGNSRGSVFGDLDGDGDLDLVVANHAEPKGVYRNATDGAVLPPERFVSLGNALAGTFGEPMLNAAGSLQPNTLVAFQVVNAKQGAGTTLVLGFVAINAPFKGGVLVPAPDLVLPGLVTDSNGFLSLGGTWPAGVPGAFSFYLQAWVSDPAGPKGLSATNALKGTTP